MPTAIPHERVRFGIFEADLRSGELYKRGRRIKLHQQPFQVLTLLIERPGEVVTREELRRKLWPSDTFVNFDIGLNSAVRKLRGALNDSPESPRYVETLSKRGYRFIAPVVTPSASVADSGSEISGTQRDQPVADLPNELEELRDDLASDASAESRPRRLKGLTVMGAAACITSLAVVVGYREFASYLVRPQSFESLQIERLTTSGTAHRPAISEDGKFVAYVQYDDRHDSLWVRQTGTASALQIVPPEPDVTLWGATVAPGSAYVDYVRRSGASFFELWRVALLGGAPKRMIEKVYSPIGWSSDGRHIAFVRVDIQHLETQLVVADASGGNPRVLAQHRLPVQFVSLMIAARPSIAPAWSPNGRSIAVVVIGARGNAGIEDMDVVDVATGSEKMAPLPTAAAVHGTDWLGDTSLIVSTSIKESERAQLFRMSYPDGRLSRLSNDVDVYFDISLTRDRTTLAATRSDTRVGIWVGDAVGRSLIETIPWAPYWGGGTLAWAGQRLLYPKMVGGRAEIWSVSPDRTIQEVISSGSSGHSATSDGRFIVFVGSEYSLWKADGDGGHATKLVHDGVADPTVTPDDRSVVFLSAADQSPWILPLEGGPARRLANVVVASPGVDISPDGKMLLFNARDDRQSRSVYIACELPGCTSQRSFPAQTAGRVRWTPGGRSIAYVDKDTVANIWAQPLDGGPSYQLTHFTDRSRIWDFAWSRDGKRLAVLRATGSSDIVLLRSLKR
jgi:DNA-binding winged helix-turn-helix (wHTH) protein/Tol biopolymer transport system component